jgi:hypothetical protein
MIHKKRFLNFPIALLRGFPEDHKKCLEDIICYSVYKLVYSEEANFQDINDFRLEYKYDLKEENVSVVISRGEILYNSFVGTKHPWTGIHIDTWIKYYAPKRNKPELMVLLAYLALKSIIQKKHIQRNTSDNLILARMSGFGSLEGNEVPEFISQYMKKKSRTRTRLFQDLEIHFGLRRKERSRGVTFSLTLSLEELEFEVAKSKYLSKERKQKEKNAEERMKARNRINEWVKDREKDITSGN